MVLRRRLVALWRSRRLAAGAIDHLAFGVVILDGGRRVLSMNRAASAIVDRRDGLSLSEGSIHPTDRRTRCAFDEFVREALAPRSRPSGDDAVLTIDRASGSRPYTVVVCPLNDQASFHGSFRAAVALFIMDPDAPVELRPQRLRALYSLTPRETELASRLLGGSTLDDIAHQLGVTMNTVRCQLKRIFQKTGTSRQSELVILLGSLRMVA